MRSYSFALMLTGVFFAVVARGGTPIKVEGLVVPFRQVKLGSPVEAVVRKLEVKEGDFVKRGQTLAILYGPTDVLEAERAKKVEAKTKLDYEANKRLSKERIISDDKLITSQLEHDVAEIESRRAEAMILEKTLRAPWDGQIIRCFKEEGETLARTQEVFQILDYAQVFVQIYLEGKDLPRIRAGTLAQVTLSSSPQKTFEAKVHFVDPVVDAGSGLFRVKLLLDNPELEIKPGVTAQVVFEFADK